MKTCIVCGTGFKNRSSKKYCSIKCSGDISKNKRHGLCETPEYNSWTSMRERCNNKNRPAYQHYGAKGITYCERWEVFENFLADMGPRPSADLTLERIDNNGNYEPSNCKWATKTEQSRNRSTAYTAADDHKIREMTAAGATYGQVAAELGRSASSVHARANRIGIRIGREHLAKFYASKGGFGNYVRALRGAAALSQPLHEDRQP